MLRIFTWVCAHFSPSCFNRKRRLTPDISSGIYPLIFHQSAPVTIHGLGSGFFSECVGVCWAVVPSFHHVQPYYLSRYFWRLYLDNKVNI